MGKEPRHCTRVCDYGLPGIPTDPSAYSVRFGTPSGAALPIGIFTGKHGPHSLAQAEDGRFWITTALSSTLMSFDPETKDFKVYEIGEGALYPHTVRIDDEGMVWFTRPIP